MKKLPFIFVLVWALTSACSTKRPGGGGGGIPMGGPAQAQNGCPQCNQQERQGLNDGRGLPGHGQLIGGGMNGFGNHNNSFGQDFGGTTTPGQFQAPAPEGIIGGGGAATGDNTRVETLETIPVDGVAAVPGDLSAASSPFTQEGSNTGASAFQSMADIAAAPGASTAPEAVPTTPENNSPRVESTESSAP